MLWFNHILLGLMDSIYILKLAEKKIVKEHLIEMVMNQYFDEFDLLVQRSVLCFIKTSYYSF